jgi:hypothetical protein
MGKFRNGELADDRIGLSVDFKRFRSPLRKALGQDARLVRRSFGRVFAIPGEPRISGPSCRLVSQRAGFEPRECGGAPKSRRGIKYRAEA